MDLFKYSTIKAAGNAHVEAKGEAHMIVHSSFDADTGQPSEDVNEIAIDLASLKKHREFYASGLASLDELIADIEAL